MDLGLEKARNRRDWSGFWLFIISLAGEYIDATDEGRVQFADDVQRSQGLGKDVISLPETQLRVLSL
jgi:hypothetical protein